MDWALAIIITLLEAIAGVVVIYYPSISNLFFVLVVFFSLFVLFKGIKNIGDLKKAISYLMFLMIAVSFWALYNQIFMSLNLFIDRVVDHRLLGIITMPTQSFLVINNATVLIGGIILSILWKKWNLLDVYKYLIGMFTLVFMFVSVSMGIYLSGINKDHLVNGDWVVVCYISIGIAELFISAIGLSLATRLAPHGQVGGYMGLWLVNMGAGGFLAGIIANYAAIPKGVTDTIQLKHIYLHSFNIYLCIAIVAFLFTIFTTFFIKKLLGDEA